MTDSPVDETPPLSSKRVGQGVLWSYLAFVLGKVMVFISTVILARILTPADFGLVGLASVMVGYLGTIHTFGVGEAFIQSKFKSTEAANVTFFLSVGSGILLFLLSLVITPAVVAFFQEPRISMIIPVLASTYVLTGLTTVHDAMLVKELKFQKRLLPTLAQSLSKGIGSIALALMGFGVWAIVWGVMIGTLARSIVLLIVSPWRPSRAWNSKGAAEIMGFGKFMMFQNILGALQDNVDYIIVGKRLGATELGFYTLGYRAPELAIISMPGIISDVAYPAYAKLQDDRDAIRDAVCKTAALVSWVAMPAGIGLAMISSAFILTFYTDKWAAVIPVMQLLSLYAMTYTVTYNFGDAYKGIGRPDVLNKLSITTIALTILALWLGSHFGIVGVAWAHLLRTILLGLAQIVIVNRVLGVPVGRMLGAISRPLVCAGIMAFIMSMVSLALRGSSNALIMVVQVASGLTVYLGGSWIINRKVTLSIFAMAQQVLGRTRAASWTLT